MLQAQDVDVADGLSAAEIDARRARYGANRFEEAAKEPRWRAFLRQYRDLMQIVLLIAGVVSLFLPHQLETALVLIGVTLLNAAMGLDQEGKASASVAALQKLMIVKAKVRRGGELLEIPMEEVVPGDIINIEAGDLVPADGRIIRAATLEIDESALTGESAPVPKQVESVAADAALGDRVDLAFMNTQVTRGAGTIVAIATGMATEVGHISGMLAVEKDEKTPLTVQLEKLTTQLLLIAGVALIASIAIGLARNVALETLFLTAVAFSVSAIPSELPAVVTAILSKGTQTLAAAGAIVKRLRSVETLGSTSAINSDKTGTLTLNQMTAVQMAVVGRRYAISGEGYSTVGTITHAAGQPEVPLDQYMLPLALCADAEVKDGKLVGDPTEGALIVLAAKGGADPTLTRERYPRVTELPFDAAYKFMATFHRMTDDAGRDVIRAYVKGAPDQLLARAPGRPWARWRGLPARPGPRALPGRERATRQPGPARHRDGLQGLRSGDVRSGRRPAAARERPDAAGAGRDRRPAATGGEGRDREGEGRRDPRPDDHRRSRRDGAGHRHRSRHRGSSPDRCRVRRDVRRRGRSPDRRDRRDRSRGARSTRFALSTSCARRATSWR